MKFAVLFEDDPAAASARSNHMAAHLAFLEKNAGAILAAGPLKTTDGQGAGGLWLIEADDAAQVDALAKADPFWPTGLRKSVRILAWTQVFAEGRRLIPG